MSQTTLQGKQQALMRVAASRVAVVDAVSATRERASSCLKALPVSPAVLVRVGTAIGAATTVIGTLSGLRRRRKLAEKAAAKTSAPAGLIFQLLMQLLGPVLLPAIQKFLQDKVQVRASSSSGRTMGF
jgi:hypothetical protein